MPIRSTYMPRSGSALLHMQVETISRSQCNPLHGLGRFGGHEPKPHGCEQGRQPDNHLEHREARPDADPRPGAERHVSATWPWAVECRPETVRIEQLRLVPE